MVDDPLGYPSLLARAGILDAVFRPGFGSKPDDADPLVRGEADAVGLVGDAGECAVDHSNPPLLILDQTERKLVLPVVTPQISHVNGHG